MPRRSTACCTTATPPSATTPTTSTASSTRLAVSIENQRGQVPFPNPVPKDEQIVKRNLTPVDAHFDSENASDFPLAQSLGQSLLILDALHSALTPPPPAALVANPQIRQTRRLRRAAERPLAAAMARSHGPGPAGPQRGVQTAGNPQGPPRRERKQL